MSRTAQMALLGSAVPPADISYVGLTTTPSRTDGAFSIADVPIGDEASNRDVTIIVHWFAITTTRTLTAATIGGVAATIHAEADGAAASSYKSGVAIIKARVPTGTTATVTLTFAGGTTVYPYLETYRVTGLLSATAQDTVSTTAASATSKLINMDVKKDGVSLVGYTAYGGGMTFAVSGATLDYDSLTATSQHIVGASLENTADEINRAITLTRSGSSNTFNAAVVAASFR